MDFYKILLSIMDERNLSIPDISRSTGLSDSTIRSIISRKTKKVSLEVAFKLSKGLDVSLERLNGDDELKYINKNTPVGKERELLNSFNKLNNTGKDQAIKRVCELTLISMYTEKDRPFTFKLKDHLAEYSDIETIAAHNDHLHEPGEIDKIMEDIEDMKNW